MFRAGNRFLPAALLPVLLLVAEAGLAERADNESPIHLEADQVLIDDAQQTSTFTGNVRLSQGSLLIRGDKIVVVHDKNGVKRATAYGKTADFRQKREGTDGFVEGYGERIEYDTEADTLNLHKQARLKRGEDEVRGERIIYNAKAETFQVSGGADGSEAPQERVRAVLQPKPKTAPAGTPAPGASPATPGDKPPPTK